jgi:hypothetical protein
MTTGPRDTPYPIILHVDDSGNPVRLAEASAIYTASATILSATITTLSATNYLGLNVCGAGLPAGGDGQVQYRRNATQFGADSGFTYNEADSLLNVTQLQANNFSSLYGTFLNNLTRAEEFSSLTVSTLNSRIGTLSATTISAITVCATNYNSLFDSLSFTNLDNRYLNSSGESVTGSFYIQNLSGAVFSATTYLNLPSGAAVWNASALAGRPVTSTAPGQYEILVFDGVAWVPSGIDSIAGVGATPNGPAGSVQFKSGSTFVGSSTVKYNESISGLELTNTSSVNLSSTNIRSTTVSATDYLNIPSGTSLWNANKIADVTITKVPVGNWQNTNILAYFGGSLVRTAVTDYGGWVYDEIESRIHTNLPQTNASAIRGVSVTSTAPVGYDVLVYNGSVWTPSASVLLSNVSSTNLGGTTIVGSRASITNVTATIVSATNLSATNYFGLPSGVATWNASAIKGANVVTVDAGITTANPVGVFVYNKTSNEYLTIPFSSVALNGTRDISITALPIQGQVVASYLGSASPYFQINPAWNTPGLNHVPVNKDVLVFSSNLYNTGQGSWTWAQPSALYRTSAAGSTGYVQFAGAGGAFSGDSNLIYYPEVGKLDLSTIWADIMYFPGNDNNSTYITKSGMNVQFLQVFGSLTSPNVSATYYNIFGKQTSSTGSPTPTFNNQTITYDSAGQQWKPGYAVYQATGVPDNSVGSNGDIYFRYIP